MKPVSRNLNIELLRCIAILSIALFHTFVPYFNALAYGANADGLNLGMGHSFLALFLMGLVNFLGSAGNFIFYMISGYFLIPRAIKEIGIGFWSKQARSVGKRCFVIIGSVIVFAILTVFLHFAFHMPTAPLNTARWLGEDLEFIWLYLIFCILAPLIAMAQKAWKHWWAFLLAALAAIFLINAFMAFFSQGGVNHPLVGWRKLMSAATYLGGFCLAGLAGEKRWEGSVRIAKEILWICILAAIFSTFFCAIMQNWKVSGKLSFKSTSIISFGVAISSLLLCASSKKKNGEFRFGGLVAFFANGILGFYIFQSMLTSFWHYLTFPVLNSLSRPGFFPFFSLFLFAAILTFIYTCVLSSFGSWVRASLLKVYSKISKLQNKIKSVS